MKPQDLIGETVTIVEADDHSITVEALGGWTNETVTGRYTIMLTNDEVLAVVET